MTYFYCTGVYITTMKARTQYSKFSVLADAIVANVSYSSTQDLGCSDSQEYKDGIKKTRNFFSLHAFDVALGENI